MKTQLNSTNAPKALGPYSQGIKCCNMIFCSGQIPLCSKTGELETNIAKATKLVLQNMSAVLKEGGATFNDVVKTTVFLKDLEDFAEMNKVYETFFTAPYPARSTIEVARLPKDSVVEIECIACVNA